MSTTRVVLSQKDFDKYKILIKQGDTGIDAMYRDLEMKGYKSAAWSYDEYKKLTHYGAATAVFFENQMGKPLNREAAEKLYKAGATYTLNMLENKVNSGKGGEDLTYDESRNIRRKSYIDAGFIGATWLFESAFIVKAGVHGEKAANHWYEENRDAGGNRVVDDAKIEEIKKVVMSTYDDGQVVFKDNLMVVTSSGFSMSLDTFLGVHLDVQARSDVLEKMFDFIKEVAGEKYPYHPDNVHEIKAKVHEAIARHQSWHAAYGNQAYDHILKNELKKAQDYAEHQNKYGVDNVEAAQEWLNHYGSDFDRELTQFENNIAVKVASFAIPGAGAIKVNRAAIPHVRAFMQQLMNFKREVKDIGNIKESFKKLKDIVHGSEGVAVLGATGATMSLYDLASKIINENHYLVDLLVEPIKSKIPG